MQVGQEAHLSFWEHHSLAVVVVPTADRAQTSLVQAVLAVLAAAERELVLVLLNPIQQMVLNLVLPTRVAVVELE